MEGFYKLAVEERSTVKILQITDTHLFESQNSTLLGVNTYNCFHAVLNAIKAQAKKYDLVVATGDLAQDFSAKAYQHFADGIGELSTPCVWLPGNHDFQPVMADVLNHSSILPFKQVLLGKDWHVILLDSQVMGVAYGELTDYQLDWLDHNLAAHSDRHALVLLHHHPIDSGCIWLDQHRLRNSHSLNSVLSKHVNVKVILCGHIHQELDVMWDSYRLLTTPSTCVQFKPHSTNFTLDTLTPGWRELDLYADGSVKTTVYRLETKEFLPDMDSDGY